MQARVESANSTILAMEEKVREMSHHDETLVDTVKRVRENAEIELKRYQEESEHRHNRCAHEGGVTSQDAILFVLLTGILLL